MMQSLGCGPVFRLMIGTAAIAAAAVVISAPVHAETVWNLNLIGPQRAVTAGIEAFTEYFKTASDGELDIRIAYGEALGPAEQAPESIRAGAYEAGYMCLGYYPNKFPLLNVTSLPFLTTTTLEDRAKLEAAVLKHPLVLQEMAERWNLRPLTTAPLTTLELMGTKRIASTDDFAGTKVRVGGLGATVLQEFGAVPTTVASSDAYSALERKILDSYALPYAYGFGAYKLYEVSDYVTNGLGLNGAICFFAVSMDAWNALPDHAKALLPEAQKRSTDALLTAFKAADEKWVPVFNQELEITPFPDSERAKLIERAGSLWEDWVQEQEDTGRPGREMLEFMKAELAKFD